MHILRGIREICRQAKLTGKQACLLGRNTPLQLKSPSSLYAPSCCCRSLWVHWRTALETAHMVHGLLLCRGLHRGLAELSQVRASAHHSVRLSLSSLSKSRTIHLCYDTRKWLFLFIYFSICLFRNLELQKKKQERT